MNMGSGKNDELKISRLIATQNDMLVRQRELYLSAIEKINLGTKELLNNDFGSMLVKNMTKDLIGESARRYFDFGDYYITVDQLYDRFVNFSYENDIDLLNESDSIKKLYYNFEDDKISETIINIRNDCEFAQKKLFDEDRAQDKFDIKGKKAYRQSKTGADGKIYDELTGREGKTNKIFKNGKAVDVSDLQADHIQARETIYYNSKYIPDDKIEKLKEFYNSDSNMQMIHASANASKGDVRVCEVDGKIEYLNSKEMKSRQNAGESIKDITGRATPEQLTEAIISQWEKEIESGNKRESLEEKGYIDENGKVKPEIEETLLRRIKNSQNKESIEILKDIKYGEIAGDAGKETAKALKKILVGQIIYYAFPPIIFETQRIIKKKNITLDKFYVELKKAGRRVINYVQNKMKDIFKNVVFNSINKFLKTFFDIIIEMVKDTVRKLISIIKKIVLSLVNCCKVLMNKNLDGAEKADAVTNILSVTITTVVLELIFEYLEKQCGLPDFLMEPLQIIVTILSTNIVMLVLQKMDLFNVRYGLLTSNIRNLFDEVNREFNEESTKLYEKGTISMKDYLDKIESHIEETENSIALLDIKKEEITPHLKKLNSLFNMGINFDKEWNDFINIA